MKNLIYKEFKLAAHPTTFIFWSFGLMLLIPAYPGYVEFVYVVMSIFFIFLTGRENKDVLYTVSLPIPKQDVVKARCLMLGIIELLQIVISIPFAIIAHRLYPGGNPAGIDANVAFFGFVFAMLTVYNLVLVPSFYKTAIKIGIPFLLGLGAMIAFYFLAESLVWMPSGIRDFLDTTDPAIMTKQLPILAGGIAIWGVGWLLVYRKAAANFEKVDV